MKRVPSRELLDDDAGTAEEVAGSLADLRFFNQHFGGIATTEFLVERVAQESRKTELSILEVAAGSGDVPDAVRTRLQKKGIVLKLTLLDRRSSHMNAAGNGTSVTRVEGDALALPFSDSSFDIVSCGLFLHHLAPEQIAVFVNEALRCTRMALIVNDLVRNRVAWATACAGRPIYRSRLTRNDATASVRQAYTVEEMRAMLVGKGAARVEITRHYFYRMGAIVWKELTATVKSHV